MFLGRWIMEDVIRIVSEAVVLVFNLLIYVQLTVCKKDNFITRLIMYVAGIILSALFLVVTCMKILPESLASAVCVSIPSFIVFFILSKYKDFRFFVTFCFLDTITFIFVFFIRFLNISFGNVAGIVSLVLVAALMFYIYVKGRPYFRNYRELISSVEDGWAEMALSTLLIYILLIFLAAYPKPLIDRKEYLPAYAFLVVTVISFYAVFLTNLSQRKKLSDLNKRLIKEKRWHKIAMEDALTGLGNRVAYMEDVRKLEETLTEEDVVYIVVMDINNFKLINDTFGHHTGDLVLKSIAERVSNIFSEENYATYRIGGDEFVIIAQSVPVEILKEKIDNLKASVFGNETSVSLSIGYKKVFSGRKDAIKNAFIRADEEMYKDKSKSKAFDSE